MGFKFLPQNGWRKSTASGDGNCVEVAFDSHVVLRQSSDADGPTLAFTKAEWTAFITGVKQGEFDLPPE